MDVGEDCTFHRADLVISSSFKDGKVVCLHYRAEAPAVALWRWLLYGKGKGEGLRELSANEISDLLWISAPHAQWVVEPPTTTIHRWRTADSAICAYYFASGYYDLHYLIVQTAAVDAIFKRVDEDVRQLRPKGSNQAMQPTPGRRTHKFPMTPTSSLAATRALASGG